jgi:hypothetical protein
LRRSADSSCPPRVELPIFEVTPKMPVIEILLPD